MKKTITKLFLGLAALAAVVAAVRCKGCKGGSA